MLVHSWVSPLWFELFIWEDKTNQTPPLLFLRCFVFTRLYYLRAATIREQRFFEKPADINDDRFVLHRASGCANTRVGRCLIEYLGPAHFSACRITRSLGCGFRPWQWTKSGTGRYGILEANNLPRIIKLCGLWVCQWHRHAKNCRQVTLSVDLALYILECYCFILERAFIFQPTTFLSV